jgi:tetratricopeptide (TPR) repeat protein
MALPSLLLAAAAAASCAHDTVQVPPTPPSAATTTTTAATRSGAARPTQAAPPAAPPRARAVVSIPQVAPALAPPPTTIAGWARGAQIFPDLGDLHRAVTTRSPAAQAYFDQGLRLAYGFNHDEAARSFAEAAELDPRCAMCFWGLALALGPNYNVPMLPDRARVAWQALERARALAPAATPVEQALIAALAQRYGGPQPRTPQAQQPFNLAYAAAMRQVARAFPVDDDVQVLFAESLMDTNPWKLWTPEGAPAPGTPEIIATLETVLRRDPFHPGANHYYIHAVEASPSPGRAIRSADLLPGLMPGAGHIVHMPAHIYQRVGRYADASQANRRAIEADKRYLAAARPPGYYPMYVGHNWGFLAFSTAMEGRSAESIAASREAARALPPQMLAMMPGMDFFASEPLLTMVRFGKWGDILYEPRPPAAFMVQTALWLHARGMAEASTERLADAKRDLAELRMLRASMPADLQAGNNSARDIANVAALALEARIAEIEGQTLVAIGLWRQAVAAQDRLVYAEPADWFYPLRHFLGAALLDAQMFPEAEQVYREDLRRNPGNGWAIYGLTQTLRAEGRTADADLAEQDFRRAWANADFTLARSAF